MLISVCGQELCSSLQSAVEIQTKIHKDFKITDNVSTKAFSWMKVLASTSRGLLRDCEIFANLRLQLY